MPWAFSVSAAVRPAMPARAMTTSEVVSGEVDTSIFPSGTFGQSGGRPEFHSVAIRGNR